MFLAGISADHGVRVVDTEFFKVLYLGTRILPLFPDQTAKSPDNPGFQGFEYVPGFGQAEVVPPSSEIHIQFFDNLVQALTTVTICQLPDPLFEPFDGFDMTVHGAGGLDKLPIRDLSGTVGIDSAGDIDTRLKTEVGPESKSGLVEINGVISATLIIREN